MSADKVAMIAIPRNILLPIDGMLKRLVVTYSGHDCAGQAGEFDVDSVEQDAAP